MKNRLALLLLLLVATLGATAQEDPEYRLELGAGAGLAAYQGDLGGSLLGPVQPLGTLVAKYKPNPRMTWALLLGYGQLKGSAGDAGTWYPDQGSGGPASFKNALTDAHVRFEYNFWAYGTGREYRGARPLVPFMAIGAGLSFGGGATGFQLPLGVGAKYKAGDRLNLTLEWVMHFTGTDGLDGVEDPYGIRSNGLFKNTDSYSVLALTLTYDLWAKCKTCNNDRD